MHKFKVGDKFKVTHTNSSNTELAVNMVHTIQELTPNIKANLFPFYLSDFGWYLEDTHVENRVLISGSDYIIAVLDKTEEPDT